METLNIQNALTTERLQINNSLNTDQQHTKTNLCLSYHWRINYIQYSVYASISSTPSRIYWCSCCAWFVEGRMPCLTIHEQTRAISLHCSHLAIKLRTINLVREPVTELQRITLIWIDCFVGWSFRIWGKCNRKNEEVSY